MKRFLTNWWFVSATVTVLALALMCWGLPIFVALLRPWWVRLLWFVAIGGTWGGLAWLRVRKARKAAEALAAELGQGDGEDKQVADRMRDALQALRASSGGKRDYLYSRPWYVIIGPPGAGKTTALTNSGLRFPYSSDAVKGVGGTRNVDFLFADEAVLVDTAGRYTSQDSDAAADAKGWLGFLRTLRRNRPRQPVNGVIVAIGIDELMRGDVHAIDAHAMTVRRRLSEISRTLELDVPIYVLITKADLIAGFVEYFDDLDVEGRRAVLGHTLDFRAPRPSADTLTAAFDDLARAIDARQAKRLADEPDGARRAMILGFAGQLPRIRARLLRFLDGAFVSGGAPAALRGFYFCSGMQEGTPIDRILAGMADIYDQPRHAVGGSGRAYFLNRLLTEVLFAEAGLGQLNPAAHKRQKFQFTAATAAIAAFALFTVGLWSVSYAGNRNFQAAALTRATELSRTSAASGIDLVEVRDSDPGLEQALDLLRQARNLPGGYAENKAGGAPLTMRFGLYQRSLSEQAQEAYRETLRRVLLPRIMLQLETAIASNVTSPMAVYEPLKIYLMLGGRSDYGVDRAAVKSWVTRYWADQAYSGADSAGMRKELGQHLDALLEDENLAISWQNRQAPLNGQLIASARAALTNTSIAERAYAIMRQKALAADAAPWTASTELASGDARAFANGEAVLHAEIPRFFTAQGYERYYQTGLSTVELDLKRDLWVFGDDAQTSAIRSQLGQVRSGVANLYAQEYIAHWTKLITMLEPADYFSDSMALSALTRTPSPLKLLLLELRRNTRFAGGSRAAGDMIADKARARAGAAAPLVPAGGTPDAGRIIEANFKPLHDYVGDDKAPGPLDTFLKTLRDAAGAVQGARMTGGGMGGDAMQAQMNAALVQVQQAAGDAPDLLQTFVARVAKGGGQQRNVAATGAVADAFANTVLPACQQATQDRFPFFSGAEKDVSISEAENVFGSGRLIDSFVEQRLKPMLVQTGPVWRWKPDDPVAAMFDPASPNSFAKAAQVRDLLIEGVTVTLEAIRFEGGIDAAQFDSGDSHYLFAAGKSAPKQLRWTAQGGAPAAAVVLMRGGQEVSRVEAGGAWALFRLMEKADRENRGPRAFLASFHDSDGSVTFRVTLPSDRNPFGRGGIWSFRCPLKL